MAHSPPRGVGKNDSRYWRSKIFRRVDPRGIESAHYATRIQWRGRRHRFALGTANKEAAAAKAAAIWRDLTTHGLEMTLAKHKAQPQAQDTIVSVGEWLAATQRVFTRRPATFGDYARSLRLIVSEILAVAKGRARFGRGGASDYRHIIEGAPLAILSARAVREWQIRRVARAAGNRRESVRRRSQLTRSCGKRVRSSPRGSSSTSTRSLFLRNCRFTALNFSRGNRRDTRASSTLPSLCSALSGSLQPSR